MTRSRAKSPSAARRPSACANFLNCKRTPDFPPISDCRFDVLASRFIETMDFSLTSDQLLIRDTVRQFMEAEMQPILREYDRAEKFPAEQMRKLGEMGCCGMLV